MLLLNISNLTIKYSKGELQMIKTKKFALAYFLAVAIYYLFDFVYMPWLGFKFGFLIFIPLYPSIFLANVGGVYLHDLLKEDVFFLELGKNWINGEDGRFASLKARIKRSKKITFLVLSIWPSPIAAYLFFRKSERKEIFEITKAIAIGSIPCTFVWGGGVGVIIYAIKKIIIS